MDIHRAIYGDDNIIGSKFPQEERQTTITDLMESGLNKQVAEYVYKKKLKFDKLQGIDNSYKDMNPNGFWECPFSVQGIVYRWRNRELIEKVKKRETILKVVSQGLLASDPQYIDKIVYMVRHPRSVAKSQEKLKRRMKVDKVYDLYKDAEHRDDDGNIISKELTIHSPQMFIDVTKQAMRFFITFPEVPVLFINFDDLMADPKYWISTIYDFNAMGGDLEAGFEIVDRKLDRSKHQEIENLLWEDAEFVYNKLNEFIAMKKEKINHLHILEDALEVLEDPKREINKKKRLWTCHRAKVTANAEVCRQCREDVYYRYNMKQRSIEIDTAGSSSLADSWNQEPCLFECGMDVNCENPITIEESIKNNFWENIDLPETKGATNAN
jgi:hypothetical protein